LTDGMSQCACHPLAAQTAVHFNGMTAAIKHIQVIESAKGPPLLKASLVKSSVHTSLIPVGLGGCPF
jgi:hypothetical protein